MKWKYKTFGEHLNKVSKWHKVFAWYPVQIKPGVMCWLQTVECKTTWHHNYCDDELINHYREIIK